LKPYEKNVESGTTCRGIKTHFLDGYAALCWTLWNLRNKFTIEGKFPNNLKFYKGRIMTCISNLFKHIRIEIFA
jgi:hypothetical protein